jgi:hypothetical protein
VEGTEIACALFRVARANNLLVGRAAYETAVRLYPRDTIQYRDGARIIARSDKD